MGGLLAHCPSERHAASPPPISPLRSGGCRACGASAPRRGGNIPRVLRPLSPDRHRLPDAVLPSVPPCLVWSARRSPPNQTTAPPRVLPPRRTHCGDRGVCPERRATHPPSSPRPAPPIAGFLAVNC